MKTFAQYDTSYFMSTKDKVLKMYPDKQYYHSAEHIEFMLYKFFVNIDKFTNQYPNWKDGLGREEHVLNTSLLAILFHDIIYQTECTNNEQQSVQYCLNYLKRHNSPLGEEENMAIEQLIMGTVPHRIPDKDDPPMLKFIRDLDWLAFANFDHMLRNEILLNNEARRDGYSALRVFELRTYFYKSILGSQIFHTSVFAKLNKQARSNINTRLVQFNQSIEKLIENEGE